MAAASEPDAEAELAALSGPELVARLRVTIRRDHYEAAARVLAARDRRLAQAEAAVAGIGAVREEYGALLRGLREKARVFGAPARGDDEPRVEEADEGEVKGDEFADTCSDGGESEGEGAEGPRGDASRVPCKKKRTRRGRRGKNGRRIPASCDNYDGVEGKDEDDTELLSQRWKRLRQAGPVAAESGKEDAQRQGNSVGSLGRDPHKSSSARMEGSEVRDGQIVATPERSKVAALVQGMAVVEPEKRNGEMPSRVMLPPGPPVLDALQKGSSKSYHGGAATGEKEGSFTGPGNSTFSQSKNSSLTAKEYGASMKTSDETHEPCTDSAVVGLGSIAVRTISEQEGGNGGGARKAKLWQQASGIGEQGGSLNFLEGKFEGPNQRDREVQKKLVDPKSNHLLKSSLGRDAEDARMMKKKGSSMPSCVLALSKVDSVSPKVTKDALNGSSGAAARNAVLVTGDAQQAKGNGQMNKASMVESSSKFVNKNDGTEMQKRTPVSRQSEEGMIAREGVPFEETRTVKFPPLGIRNLSGSELRGLDTKTQKFGVLAKGDNDLSKKLINEELMKRGEKSNNAGLEKN